MAWFRRKKHGSPESPTPPVAAAHGTETSGEGDRPDVGSQLDQLAGASRISADVVRVLGDFNPRRVTLDDMFLMMRHPTVAFGLAILRGVLMNMVWTVESDDIVIKDFVDKALRRRFRQLARSMSLAVFLGMSHAEIVWAVKKLVVDTEQIGADGKKEQVEKTFPAAWVIERFKNISPKTTTFIIDEEIDEWIGIEQAHPGGKEKGDSIFVPREKMAHWAFRSEDVFGDLHGFGVAEQVYTPWYSSIAMGLSTDRYFEKRAEGNFVARFGREITIGGMVRDGAAWISDRITRWMNGGVLTLPNDRIKGTDKFVWDVQNLEGDKRGDMFQTRIDALDISILRAMFITDKAATGGDGAGSFAMAKVHADTMSQMIAAIETEFVDDIVNPQAVDRIVLFNFGQQALDDTNTRVVEAGMSQSQRDAIKEFVMKLLDGEAIVEEGGSLKLGDLVDKPMLARLIGLPMISKEEMAALLELKAKRKAAMEDQLKGKEPDDTEPDDTEPDAVKEELIKAGVTEDE